jgi:hypothetical protein
MSGSVAKSYLTDIFVMGKYLVVYLDNNINGQHFAMPMLSPFIFLVIVGQLMGKQNLKFCIFFLSRQIWGKIKHHVCLEQM